MLRLWATGLVAAGLALCEPSAAQPRETPPEAPPVNIVGTPTSQSNFALLEKPLFTEILPQATGQRLKGVIKPANELNLDGTQLLRLLKQGVFDFAFILQNYVVGGSPVVEGADIAGVASSVTAARGIVDAWRSELAAVLREQHNAVVLATFSLPEQDIFCKAEIKSIDDLKGRKIRVHTIAQSDLATALGAAPVNVSLSGSFAALEKGAVDCGMTSTLTAYRMKWQDVSGFIFRLPVGFTTGLLLANANSWIKLTPELRAAVEREAKTFEREAWDLAARETRDGLSCLTGSLPCLHGPSGRMKLASPGPVDLAASARALNDSVLKAWAQRCGKACADRWNELIGRELGLNAVE